MTWLFWSLLSAAHGFSLDSRELRPASRGLCYFRALQLGPASRVAPVDKLSVVLVIVLAALFLGERLTLAKAAGGLMHDILKLRVRNLPIYPPG